jgi:SAM-dependent methyltransferase
VKPRLLDLLACPLCRGDLSLDSDDPRGGEIMEGRLECGGCHERYAITRGVPRLVPPDLGVEQRRTADTFGWEWRHFVEMHDEYEEQFLDWIHPIRPAFFADRLVLDAGCGIGRHTYFAARYGAREVVGMDLSAAVDTAFHTLSELPNAHVVQGDIYHPPFARDEPGGPFDFIYSIGVLHHLPAPRAGFESLLRFVRPGGEIFGWVYGHENNAVVHQLINPIRKVVTSRLPAPIVSTLSWPIAAILQGVVKLVYRPLRGSALFTRLPSAEYLHSLSAFSFRQNHSIVFDHLVAPTAYYIKREDFERWFTENGLEDVEISWRNQNSWRGRGRVPARRPDQDGGFATEATSASGGFRSTWPVPTDSAAG